MWEETEHEAANQIARPTRRTIHHFADADIPVFDRAGEFTFLEGGAHRLILRRRHFPPEDQRLGSAADR